MQYAHHFMNSGLKLVGILPHLATGQYRDLNGCCVISRLYFSDADLKLPDDLVWSTRLTFFRHVTMF